MDSRVWGFLDVHKVKGRAFIVYFSVRSEEIPYTSALLSIYHVVTNPGMIRWSRLGSMVR
jgi:hypothetical protein